MRRAVQLVAFSVWCTVTLLLLPAWVLYTSGNGPVPGAFALGGLVLGAGGVAVATLTAGRALRVGLGGLLVAEGVFAATRWSALDTSGYCRNGVCGASPPVLAALVREPESARAGVVLSRAAGLLYPGEAPGIAALVEERYGHVEPDGVNALLLWSTPASVSAVVDRPAREDPVPAIVFLHGFGGLMTTYVTTLRAQPRLAGYAIVAPALGIRGEWWSAEGRAVVGRTLDLLPAGIDPDRVWLVGLSNGAVGAMAVAADPTLAGRFRGIVAVEGGGLVDRVGVARVPVRLVAAEDDPRFPLGYVTAVAEELGPLGSLAVIPGDHLAFFAHPAEATAAVADAIGAP